MEAQPAVQVRGRCSPLHLARDLAERSTEGPPIVVAGNDVTAGVPANLVERILVPLLNNARRYARNQITVECTADVEIIITDDGPGDIAIDAAGRFVISLPRG
ncbi:hypothetical protein [Actinoallomurus iriomotensis]|uniref:hypothetical protein n=1 Tax=Actinoallomurus iriomotensis TaxID=478107 RepID=UPI0025554FF3|nr:hypothetical protein [Actinoallomurus iriomotensis]